MDIELTETIATFKGVNPGPSGTGVRFVKGYYAAGDAGAGIFEWDAASTLEDNGGTVIKPTEASTGRWIRQFDVRGPVHAEWFGAQGDGSTADHVAIQACLTHLKRVTLLARQYVLENHVLVPAGSILEGQGMDKTVVINKAQPNDHESPPAPIYAQTAPFQSDAAEPSDGAVVRDLTVDCWFTQAPAESRKHHTRAAVILVGSGILIERVKATNFGVGYNPDQASGKNNGGECFVLYACNGEDKLADGKTQGNIIRDCLVTAPGTRSQAITIDPNRPMPEITCLTVGGRYAPEDTPTVLAEGGAIAGNRVYDINYQPNTSPYQYSSPHAITVANCRGTEIADNEVINCDGVGAYVVSWTDEAVVIRNNRFLGVNVGINVGVIASEVTGGLYPSHSGMRIEQNLILLGRNTHLLADMDWMAGVLLYAEDSIPGGSRLKGITVARNFVRGDKITEGQTTYSALGVLLMLNSPIFESIHVNDNVLEVPDAAELNTAYENALVFSPTYRAVDPAAGVGGEVRAHGNRNLSGQDMRFKYQQYQQMSQWGPYSQRLARFKAPSFGGRAGVFYDEFMGALPRSALGWQGLTSGSGAAIAEQDGQAKRPGIARLSTGTDIAGLSELRYSSSSIVLGGGLTHLFGFAARRAQQSAYPTDFDCVLGLVASDSSNVGVYFKITSGGTYNNQWTAICTDTSQERVVGVSDFEYAPPPWRSFRIEVQADASAVEFLIDGKWFGRATSYLPTVPLFMILMIRNRSQPYHGANHDLLVDHFSHQVF